MFPGTRALVRLGSGRRLVLLFCATILLPGVLLAVFGGRALLQERRFASQQLRARLDLAAEIAARDLEREMNEWLALLEQVERAESLEIGKQPERIRAPLEEPGAGAIVFRHRDGGEIWPPQQKLYELSPGPVALAAPEPQLAEAESAEFLAKDYMRAERLYRRELVSGEESARPQVLHRLARTLRKAGRYAEAHATYRELTASSALVGTLPADLIARYEICSLFVAQDQRKLLAQPALHLYRDLVAGRWALERSRYAFYAATARDWASGDPALDTELARLTGIERRKRELIEAAAALLEAPRSATPALLQPYVVLQADGHPSSTLLLSRSWASNHLWPQLFKTALADELEVEVVGPGGDVLFRSAATTGATDTANLARTADALRGSWRVRVWPRNPGVFSAEVARRQTVYLVMLSLVVALLSFGTYLTTRVVKKELEIARLKSDFVSTVSHEFRSPLTGIRQLGEMLMRGRVTSEGKRQEYYERITHESDRLSRLVENLLDFSRMEDGRKEYRFEPLETAAWLRAVVADARRQHADRQIEIVATIPESLPPLVGDQTALACAVHNLIDNAVKYSPGRDAVWLEADALRGHVTIRVRDAGVGISEHERGHIFQKFYRGHGEITRQVTGAGLGLALVEQIVSAHRGTVQCDGHVGEGTTFSIRLAVGPANPYRSHG